MNNYFNILMFILLFTITSLTGQDLINSVFVDESNNLINLNEPSIATHDINGNRHVVVAVNLRETDEDYVEISKEIACYTTTNDGQTWTRNIMPGISGSLLYVDPSVVFDETGTAWCGYVTAASNHAAVLINKSTDGGITWLNEPIIVIESFDTDAEEYDKPYIYADNFNDQIGITFTKQESLSSGGPQAKVENVVYAKANRNDPSLSFSFIDVELGDSGIAAGDNNGNLFVVHTVTDFDETSVAKFNSSTNTFVNKFNTSFITSGYNGKLGQEPNTFRTLSLPAIAIDNTGGDNDGNIYVCWSGRQTGADVSKIFLVVSTDHGENWSQPVSITPDDDEDREEIFPWITVNPDGAVGILYYWMDDRYSSEVVAHIAISIDGGSTFQISYLDENAFNYTTLNLKYDDPPFFIGDYLGITHSGNEFIAAWTDTENDNGRYPEKINVSFIPYKNNILISNLINSQNHGRMSVNNENIDIEPNGTSLSLELLHDHSFGIIDHYYNDLGDNEFYYFRNWDNNSYLTEETRSFNYYDPEYGITSSYNISYPLKVKNNLEGNEDGIWQVKWDKNGGFQSLNSSEEYYAFNFPTTGDLYDIKAEESLQNNIWQFSHWGDAFNEVDRLKQDVSLNGEAETFVANYKGHFRAGNTTAFYSNSQRKVVRTDDGFYHLVYSSLGRVWYTKSLSSNFDGNWDHEINSQNQINNLKGGINPSIDYFGNEVAIVFEQDNGDGTYSIALEGFGSGHYEAATLDATFFGQANPVVAFTKKEIMVAWRPSASSGFEYRLLEKSGSTWQWVASALDVPNSNSSCSNISIAGRKNTNDYYGWIYLVWQYNNNNIKYQDYYRHSVNRAFYDYQTISTGSGTTLNYKPSIALNNNTPIVSWTGRKKIFGAGYQYRAVIKNDPENSSTFYSYGTLVDFTNINTAESGETVVTLSENSGANCMWIRRDNLALYTYDDLSHDGVQTQVSNAADLEDMRAVVFNNNSLPYILNKSTTDFSEGGLSKTSSVINTSYSREGVISKGELEFTFSIGDVFLDDQPVSFIDYNDTTKISSTTFLNSFLRTKPIYLNSSSSLFFSHFFDVINDSLATGILTDQDAVHFNVNLMQETTDIVVAEIDQLVYNKNNAQAYGKNDYQLNCTGIQPGDYYLQLNVDVNGEADFSVVSNVSQNEDGLGKNGYQVLEFSEIHIPLAYSLSQNHPNPFNPSTTITYHIEKEEHVVIKVFDIAGREISTLVDSVKPAGRYQIYFDGTGLASGVYIYTMSSGKFIDQKKMLLLK